jgi:hypothetical protein
MEIQDILNFIMQENKCSPIYALYLLSHIQEELRGEQNVHSVQC